MGRYRWLESNMEGWDFVINMAAGWKLPYYYNKQIQCVRSNRLFESAWVIFQENLLESGITWYSEYSSVLASISYLRRLLLMTLYVLSSADTWKQWKIFNLKNRTLLRGYAARALSYLFLTKTSLSNNDNILKYLRKCFCTHARGYHQSSL